MQNNHTYRMNFSAGDRSNCFANLFCFIDRSTYSLWWIGKQRKRGWGKCNIYIIYKGVLTLGNFDIKLFVQPMYLTKYTWSHKIGEHVNASGNITFWILKLLLLINISHSMKIATDCGDIGQLVGKIYNLWYIG